jgi:hypothetical protein
MMPQGFLPLESVHQHTLGIWAEVFMCDYNGCSSNKMYERCDQIVFLSGRFMGYSYGAVAWLQPRNLSVKVYTTDVCTLAVWSTNLSQCTQVGNIFFEDRSSSKQHGKSSREQTGILTMISRGDLASLPYDILYHSLSNGKRSAISLLFT